MRPEDEHRGYHKAREGSRGETKMAWRHTQEAQERASKPVEGHKGHVVFGAKYRCECGWQTGTYFGKGAQGQAANEFFFHKLDCLDAARG